MRDPMRLPNAVRRLATRLGFEVSEMQGTQVNGHVTIRKGVTSSPVEVRFHRAAAAEAWLWTGAVHRVHASDPIYKGNEGQPELTTYTAFKAYLSLLSVTLK